ncbi:MAG: segregation/condensation protein A [Leptospiraceae bacterium]|nr:segregation/condensation protein A [Leptospiraceae bacterium]
MEPTDTLKEDHPFLVRWNNSDGGFTEGPLTLLWSLIESYKVDIFEVSLSRITEDFISFLKHTKNLPIELGSEFTKMAASLVYLKSKALLPNPGFEEIENEPTLPKELVDKLLEHKKYQIAGKKLAELDIIQSSVFKRESNQIIIDFPEDENWLDIDLIDLIAAYNSILNRQSVNEEVPNLLIAESNYSIDEKIQSIEEKLQFKKEIFFSEIFESEDPEVYDIVYSFMALLEIVKLKKVKIKQHRMFGDIKIFLAE